MLTPNRGEDKKTFIDRYMIDKEAIDDFPNEEQRFVLCNNIFEQDRKKQRRNKRRRRRRGVIRA